MARNLQALLPLVLEYGPERIAFCTDDRDPEDIADHGHINGMVREAVAAGVAPGGCSRDGLAPSGSVARPRPARGDRPGLSGRPASAPRPRHLRSGHGVEARAADRGRSVRRRPRLGPTERARPSARRREPRHSVVRRPDPRDRVGRRSGRDGVGDLRSRRRGRERRRIDASADLAKIAVVERHLATGRVGLGFVSGSGLQRGALASSVAHDAHNLVVVGMNDEDMVSAVAHLAAHRRWDRRGRRRPGRCGMPTARCRSALGCPTRNRDREQPCLQRGRVRARLVRGDAVSDARLPRPLRDPVAQDHGPRPRRCRPLRNRSRWRSTQRDRDPDRAHVRRRRCSSRAAHACVRARMSRPVRAFTPGIELEVHSCRPTWTRSRRRRWPWRWHSSGARGRPPVPPRRGGGGRGPTGEALPDPRRRRAVHRRAGHDSRGGPSRGAPARRDRIPRRRRRIGRCSAS